MLNGKDKKFVPFGADQKTERVIKNQDYSELCNQVLKQNEQILQMNGRIIETLSRPGPMINNQVFNRRES